MKYVFYSLVFVFMVGCSSQSYVKSNEIAKNFIVESASADPFADLQQ